MCERINIPEQYIKNNSSDYFTEIYINTWEEAKQVFGLFSADWIFRGQVDSQWNLVPSIERLTNFAGSDDLERIIIEGLIGSLKDVLQNKSSPETDLGWMAFAQHHGGLTRLLDFTKDPYIACFFAFGLNLQIDVFPESCAVWCFNQEWCKAKTLKRLKKTARFSELKVEDMESQQFFNDAFVYNSEFIPCVCPFISDWRNERMDKQKSTFLCKCDPVYSFDSNIIGEDDSILESQVYVKKIILPRSICKEALNSLEDKNITEKTMLPGEEHFQEMRDIVKEFEKHARVTIRDLKDRVKS